MPEACQSDFASYAFQVVRAVDLRVRRPWRRFVGVDERAGAGQPGDRQPRLPLDVVGVQGGVEDLAQQCRAAVRLRRRS